MGYEVRSRRCLGRSLERRIREPVLADRCGPDALEHLAVGRRRDVDLAELDDLREAADVLVGPLPETLIPEQPTEWIDERGLELLDRWSRLTDDADHAGLMVLIACQIWRWAVERRHASKDEAGHWVLELDPTLSAVRAALAQRRGDASRSISPSGIAQVLDAARHAVEGRGPA
jgi:hypothetical protein